MIVEWRAKLDGEGALLLNRSRLFRGGQRVSLNARDEQKREGEF